MRASALPVASLLVASLAAFAGSIAACGGGKLTTTSPRPTSSLEATGEPRCVPGKDGKYNGAHEPLIVEWPSTSRAKLEALSHSALVVVHFESCRLEVLGSCKVKGAYVYTPITRKHDLVRIDDAAELWASVPLGAAQLEGKLAQAGALHVEMTIVGRFEADRLVVPRAELDGDCEGATHLVSGMVAGAFDFFTGDKSSVGASATVFGAGGGASSSSSVEHLNVDGDEKKCVAATLGDKTPPDGCGALLRIELLPFGDASLAHAPQCPEKSAWDGQACVAAQVVTNTKEACPSGMIADDAGCKPDPNAVTTVSMVVKDDGKNSKATKVEKAKKDAEKAPGCRYGDATDCTTRCHSDKDAASCADLALMCAKGEGLPKDDKKALGFYMSACDLGSALGCNQAGMRLEDGIGATKDDVAAVSLYQKACDGGRSEGCTNLARMYANGWGVSKDDPKAADLFQRACNLGDASGCSNLGFCYVKGRGVEVDRPRGVSLLRKGCNTGNKWGCDVLKKLGESP